MMITATTRAIVYRDCCTTTTDAHGCLITIYMVIPKNCPTTNAMKIDQLFTSRLLVDVDFQYHVTDVQGDPFTRPIPSRRGGSICGGTGHLQTTITPRENDSPRYSKILSVCLIFDFKNRYASRCSSIYDHRSSSIYDHFFTFWVCLIIWLGLFCIHQAPMNERASMGF